MIPFFSRRNAWECLLGALGIYALSISALELYKISGTLAVPLWPSSGLALGILLLRGWRLFPAITFGTIAATQTLGDHLVFSIAESLGNTLESLIGYLVLTPCFDFSNQMRRVRDIRLLFLLGAPVGPLVNALICTYGLVAFHSMADSAVPISILCFWAGNAMGIVVFTPVVLALGQRLPFCGSGKDCSHTAFWLITLALLVMLGFWNTFTAHTGLIPLAYLSFPILIWLALRERYGVILGVAMVTTLVTGFTTMGYGPLVRYNPMATYSELTIFIFLYAVSCLIIMAVEEERSEGNFKTRLAVSTAGLGQWEWSREEGLTLHDHPLTAEPVLVLDSTKAAETFLQSVDQEDEKLLPWRQEGKGASVGDTITGEVRLTGKSQESDGEGHPPVIVLLSGRVQRVDNMGRPVTMLGILRDMTMERASTELLVASARQEAELRSIRSHLNPHFLFNSLNVLKSLITEDATKAQRAVVSLSEVLRSSLRATRHHFIPLREEIAVTEDYLGLQKMRFENRLTAIISVEPGADAVMVPPLMLQQLVENALKHASWSSTLGMDITIAARLAGPELILRVSNPGVVRDLKQDGMGIRSIRKQLDILIGADACFDIRNNPGNRVVAEIRIPSNLN